MQLKTFLVHGEYLIGASFPEGRVVAVNSERKALVVNIELPADCRIAFALSRDGRFLATGYEYTQLSSLQVWDCESAEMVAEQPKAYPFVLAFEPSGRHLVYTAVHGKSGTYLYDCMSAQTTKVQGGLGPMNAAFPRDSRTMLMPRDRGRGGFRITFQPLDIIEIPLPTRRPVVLLRASPVADTFAMLDVGGAVTCMCVSTSDVVWKRKIAEAGWLSYSGDGRFLAVLQCDRNAAPQRLMVLDAASGELLRVIEHNERATDPLAGPKVLCLSGRFVNLETGEIETGVSEAIWWESLLRTQPKGG